MPTVFNICPSKSTSAVYIEISPNTSVKPKLSIKIRYLLYPLWLFLFGICTTISINASYASEPAEIQPESPHNKQDELESFQNNGFTSSKTFNFDGIFQLVLSLNTPGNVKIVAIDDKEEFKDTISVSLEKQALNNDPSVPLSYLKNLTMTGIRKDGILELNSQLTEEFDPPPYENADESKINNLLLLNYAIKTPPDISVNVKLKDGDIFIHHLRGKIEIRTETGNVHLDETLGNYDIEVKNGRIHGKVLFTPGENKMITHNGSIDLTVLDDLAAPLELTANSGKIDLLLPKSYSADVELKNDKQLYVINLPADVENDKGMINEGGPLLKLTATDVISVLRNPWLPNRQKETNETSPDENPKKRIVQPIPFTENPPNIDGNLTEIVWSNAVTLSAFQNPSGTDLAENPTDVRMMWDSEHLYIAARVFFTTYKIPRVSQTQQDSPMWEDDCIEVLIDMNAETEAYAHLVLNPIGGVYDQRVREEGYPSFRFAPNDIQRKPIDDSIDKFISESSWDSQAKIATKIYATYWSFEIAYPLNDGESNDENELLLNIHRKARGINQDLPNFNVTPIREFSYWLPMYDEEYPWWPHWKEGMGLLKLIKPQPTMLSSLDVPVHFEVKNIEITDNKIITSDDIIKLLPISSGDRITNEQLAWMIAELEHFDVFKNPKLEILVIDNDSSATLSENQSTTSPEDSFHDGTGQAESLELSEIDPLKVTLKIKVTENPLDYTTRVIFTDNKIFPSLFLRDWFDLTAGYIADAQLNLKQQMITYFYINRGYAFAEVSYEINDDILQIIINEGYLDEVLFTGNKRISDAELVSTLDIDTDRVFSETHAQTSMNRMGNKLSQTNKHFKSIKDWKVQQEGGRNILIIDIEEHTIVRPGVYPILGFNRVHGLILGGGGNLSTDFTGDEQLFGTLSGGFASRIFNYSIGVEKSFFETNPFAIGLGMFKLTDISTNAFRDFPVDPNLTAAAYGTDSADYYQRDGTQYWLSQMLGDSSMLRMEFTFEYHDNLSKSTDWSYYDRKRIKRDNARIETGPMNSFYIGYTFDTRDEKSTVKRPQFMGSNLIPWPTEVTKRGWRGNIGVEISGALLGGDFNYSLYKFAVVRYTPIYGPHHINIRLSGDYSNDPLPKQRALYLGGASTLRGYDFNTLAGDKRFLLNLEYRFITETQINTKPTVNIGMALYTYLDTGQVWWYNENPLAEFAFNELKTSVGVGVSFFMSPPDGFQPLSTAFEVAVPINIESEYRESRLIWRLERMF